MTITKTIISAIFLVFITSFVSADIIINNQPSGVYNLGDGISIPVTVKSVEPVTGTFNMDLLCNGKIFNFYKNGLLLNTGDEKKIDASLVLDRSILGDVEGTCRIKASFLEEYITTEEFEVSNLINLELEEQTFEFEPGETIFLEGIATKANGKNANGFIDLRVVHENSTENETYQETIKNGFFSIVFTMPKSSKAGMYLIELNASERNSLNEITNTGFLNKNIYISQIPTSLEIVFENKNIKPGEDLRAKAVLHDQTGEKIESTAILTLKNNRGNILEQTELATDEFLEYPTKYNENPATWKAFAVSNKLSTESSFKIIENEDAKIEIINKTLVVTNTGNIPYNKTLLVRIGESSTNVETFLEVDETKKYLISAPDGEYSVSIIEGGKDTVTRTVALTGNAISIKEAGKGLLESRGLSFAWIFVALILGFITLMVIRRGYKHSFFGHAPQQQVIKTKTEPMTPLRKSSLLKTNKKAELHLSLKGDKQNSNIACLKIKNLRDIERKESGTEETLQQVVLIAEENNAYIYENQDYLFFVVAPTITKTFKNDYNTLKMLQRIKETLNDHNRRFKQGIEFGISLGIGEIIAKNEEGKLKFMALGDLVSSLKKMASSVDGEIALTERERGKLITQTKTKKLENESFEAFIVEEIKEKDSEGKKFIDNLLKKWEGEKQEN